MNPKTQLIDNCIEILLHENTNTWFENYMRVNRDRVIRDFDLIIPLLEKENSTIGDLGAAPFLTSIALSKLGHQVDAFDIAPERFDHLSNYGINLRKINLDDWKNTEHNKYDLLIFTEVFEHLRGNLIEVATNILNALKPGGKVYLTTPNLRSVTGFFKLITKRVSYANAKDLHYEWSKLDTIGHMGHVREYTFYELKDFFEKIGFNVKLARTYPVKLGSGLKNTILYRTEKLLNPLTLGSGTILILEKAL